MSVILSRGRIWLFPTAEILRHAHTWKRAQSCPIPARLSFPIPQDPLSRVDFGEEPRLLCQMQSGQIGRDKFGFPRMQWLACCQALHYLGRFSFRFHRKYFRCQQKLRMLERLLPFQKYWVWFPAGAVRCAERRGHDDLPPVLPFRLVLLGRSLYLCLHRVPSWDHD